MAIANGKTIYANNCRSSFTQLQPCPTTNPIGSVPPSVRQSFALSLIQCGIWNIEWTVATTVGNCWPMASTKPSWQTVAAPVNGDPKQRLTLGKEMRLKGSQLSKILNGIPLLNWDESSGSIFAQIRENNGLPNGKDTSDSETWLSPFYIIIRDYPSLAKSGM